MKTLILSALLVLAGIYATGQQTSENIVNATGGTFESNNVTYEWNVGEISLVNTMQSDDGKYTVTNGCLQPMHHVRARSRALVAFEGAEVSILPNPAAENIFIRIRIAGEGQLNMLLFDERGNPVRAGQVYYSGGEANATINVKQLANGNYILQVKTLPVKGMPEKSGSYRIVKIS